MEKKRKMLRVGRTLDMGRSAFILKEKEGKPRLGSKDREPPP